MHLRALQTALLVAAMAAVPALSAVTRPTQAAPPPDPPAYTFVDLGAGFSPTAVNQDLVVVGDQTPSGGSTVVPSYWKSGTVTPLQGSAPHVYAIDDAGQVLGVGYDGTHRFAVIWASVTASAVTLTEPGVVLGSDEVTGNFGFQDEVTTVGKLIGPTGTLLHSFSAYNYPRYVGTKYFVGRDISDNVHDRRYLGNAVTGADLGDLPQGTGIISSDGAVIEHDSSNPTTTPVRLPSGDIVVRPIQNASAIDAQHDLTNGSQLLPADDTTPSAVSSFLPDGWSAGGISALNNDGVAIGTAKAPDSTTHGIMLLPVPKASGTVYGVSCGDTSCSRGGLAGVQVLVTGTTTTGDAVSQTTTSKADGTWALTLPTGHYDFGPTLDGSTYIGQAFDPAQEIVDLTAAGKHGIDFSTCGTTTSKRPAARRRSGGDGVSFCQSVYTVTMKAQLPKGVIVDPSKTARYNTNASASTPDYRDSTSAVNKVLHTRLFENGVVGVRRQYPSCMSEHQVEKLDEEKVHVEWYSYLKGGASLGQLKVQLAWNQDKTEQKVRVVGQPTVTSSAVTKVWNYRYTLDGKPKKGTCQTTEHARPIVVPLAGGTPGTPDLKPNQFAISVAWALPFAPQGIALNAEIGAAAILHEFGSLGKELYDRYEALSEVQKFAIDVGIGYALGTGYVKGVHKATHLIADFAPKLKYLPGVAGVTTEILHALAVGRDVVNFAAGYAGDYPVMSTILRGNFTTHYLPYMGHDTTYSAGTVLALALVSTKFPDISVVIHRDAEKATFGPAVYSGKDLPWHNSRFTTPITVNPFQKNPAGFVAYASGSGQHFHSGDHAVETILEDTEGEHALVTLEKAIEEDATPVLRYEKSLDAVPDPKCNVDGDASTDPRTTICYYLKDSRA